MKTLKNLLSASLIMLAISLIYSCDPDKKEEDIKIDPVVENEVKYSMSLTDVEGKPDTKVKITVTIGDKAKSATDKTTTKWVSGIATQASWKIGVWNTANVSSENNKGLAEFNNNVATYTDERNGSDHTPYKYTFTIVGQTIKVEFNYKNSTDKYTFDLIKQ